MSPKEKPQGISDELARANYQKQYGVESTRHGITIGNPPELGNHKPKEPVPGASHLVPHRTSPKRN